MTDMKEFRPWGAFPVYLYDELGGRYEKTYNSVLPRTFRLSKEHFAVESTELAKEALVLYRDIKEDFFRSPYALVPAPWLINSLELMTLVLRPEYREQLEVAVNGSNGFLRAIFEPGFRESFQEFVEEYYPLPNTEAQTTDYQTYQRSVCRKENASVFDEILKRDTPFFFQHIRNRSDGTADRLMFFAQWLDKHVVKVRLEDIGYTYDEVDRTRIRIALSHLDDNLRRVSIQRRSENSVFDWLPSLFLVQGSGMISLAPEIENILKSYLRECQANDIFSMTLLGQMAEQASLPEEETLELKWLARQSYIAGFEAASPCIPVAGRWETERDFFKKMSKWLLGGLSAHESKSRPVKMLKDHLGIAHGVLFTQKVIREDKIDFRLIEKIRNECKWYFKEERERRFANLSDKEAYEWLKQVNRYATAAWRIIKEEAGTTLQVTPAVHGLNWVETKLPVGRQIIAYGIPIATPHLVQYLQQLLGMEDIKLGSVFLQWAVSNLTESAEKGLSNELKAIIGHNILEQISKPYPAPR